MTAIRLVVDASVALKWYLEDESERTPALAIYRAWEDSQVELVAPRFFALEVANGLRHAALRKGRKLTKKSQEHLDDFLAMGVETVDVTRDLRAIFAEALRLRVSIYDMSIIHLAESAGIEAVTADDRLVRAVRTSKPFVKHLRDFRLPPPFQDA